MKNTWILLLFVPALLIQAGALSDKQKECINLNNEGVIAINHKDWKLAFEKLEAALKADPEYNLAKDNLAIAHADYGLQLRNEHKFAEALKELHQSAYRHSYWDTAVAETIQKMGKNPKNFEDRVELGDQARLCDDLVGAVVEYRAAIELKDDAATHRKLGAVLTSVGDKSEAELQFGVAKWCEQHQMQQNEKH